MMCSWSLGCSISSVFGPVNPSIPQPAQASETQDCNRGRRSEQCIPSGDGREG